MLKLKNNILLYLSCISFALSWITFYYLMYLEEIRLINLSKTMDIVSFSYWSHYNPTSYFFGINISFGCLGCVLLMLYIEKNLPSFKDVFNLIKCSLKNNKKIRYTFIYIIIFLLIYIIMKLLIYI